MHCCDTGEEPAVRLEYLTVKTTKRINRLIGILKQGFRGDGQVTLVMSGGNVDDIKILATDHEQENGKRRAS